MEKSTSGVGLTSIVFLIFLILKLTGNIDWSWWWVTSPLWIPVSLVLGLICLVFVIAFILVTLGLSFGMSLDDIQKRAKELKRKY